MAACTVLSGVNTGWSQDQDGITLHGPFQLDLARVPIVEFGLEPDDFTADGNRRPAGRDTLSTDPPGLGGKVGRPAGSNRPCQGALAPSISAVRGAFQPARSR